MASAPKGARGINIYDVRKFGDYEFDGIAEYLNQSAVREAFHVDPSIGPWTDESAVVAALLETREQGSTGHLVPLDRPAAAPEMLDCFVRDECFHE